MKENESILSIQTDTAEAEIAALKEQLELERSSRLEAEAVAQKMTASEEYFRRLTENALDLITILNGDGTIRFESQSIEQTLGYKQEDYIGKNAFEFVHPDDLPRVVAAFTEALQKHGNTPCLTFRFRHKDGSWRMLEGIGNNLLDDPIVKGVIFNSRDITERRRLEEQYLQSQKVAVIGRLAGGVAHDFNNILTAIMGYSELMLRQFETNNPLYGNVVEIKKAADRAAGLTKQLLAFSRKQMLDPKVIDLNHIISDMDKMLRRVIGEDIHLRTVPDANLGHVKADPNQIEQVILNLVVNARDAMPNNGHITIETANVTLDEAYAAGHIEFVSGKYVMLAISDTGTGMSKEVQAHLFEPFFTTKEMGKGTGLGLATCHGIVKQSGGHINVYSELNQGTTFKVFLPRIDGELEATTEKIESDENPHGSEIILLVEDEPVLRELSAFVLRDCGYTVLEAFDGFNALQVAKESPNGKIDLLMTDVIMPSMGGKELSEKLRIEFPDTKVLFCSGYTEDAIVHHGVLDEGIAFLQKPFTPTALAQKVRAVLEQNNPPTKPTTNNA